MDYKQLFKSEGHGSYGGFGIEIRVAGSQLPDLKLDAIANAASDAADKIEHEVRKAVIAGSEAGKLETAALRNSILALFPERIFAEEIPNGYCYRWCCQHLPWFIITTEVGRFKIGWRKHVIHIEWIDTIGTKTAEALFHTENVTKGERFIHAHSLEDARRYIATVINSVKV